MVVVPRQILGCEGRLAGWLSLRRGLIFLDSWFLLFLSRLVEWFIVETGTFLSRCFTGLRLDKCIVGLSDGELQCPLNVRREAHVEYLGWAVDEDEGKRCSTSAQRYVPYIDYPIPQSPPPRRRIARSSQPGRSRLPANSVTDPTTETRIILTSSNP